MPSISFDFHQLALIPINLVIENMKKVPQQKQKQDIFCKRTKQLIHILEIVKLVSFFLLAINNKHTCSLMPLQTTSIILSASMLCGLPDSKFFDLKYLCTLECWIATLCAYCFLNRNRTCASLIRICAAFIKFWLMKQLLYVFF